MGLLRTAAAPFKRAAYPFTAIFRRTAEAAGELREVGAGIRHDVARGLKGDLKAAALARPATPFITSRELAGLRSAARVASAIFAAALIAGLPVAIALGGVIEIVAAAVVIVALFARSMTASFALAIARGYRQPFLAYIATPSRSLFEPWDVK